MLEFKYMSERGVVETGFMCVKQGEIPGSISIYMDGRVPFNLLPKGCDTAFGVEYIRQPDGKYQTLIYDNVLQRDFPDVEGKDLERCFIAKQIMAIRVESEYSEIIQNDAKYLRRNPNEIYRYLNNNSSKYSVYRQIIDIIAHRGVVANSNNPMVKQLVILPYEECLLDKIYRMIDSNVSMSVEDTTYKNIKAIGSFSVDK